MGIRGQVSVQLGLECIATLGKVCLQGDKRTSLPYNYVMRPPARRSLTKEKKYLFIRSLDFIHPILDIILRPSSFQSVKVCNYDQRSLMANLLA